MNILCNAWIPEGLLLAGAAAEKQSNPFSTMILMFGLIAISFYFIVARPQKKEQAERKRKIETLSRGDKIVTIGGLLGTVYEVPSNVDYAVIEFDRDVRIRILKTAISNVTPKKAADAPEQQ